MNQRRKRKQDEREYFACDSAATAFQAVVRGLQALAFSAPCHASAQRFRNMTHN
jgi:hypothetical protein